MYVLILKLLRRLPSPIQIYLRNINFAFFWFFHNTSYSQVWEDIVLSNILPEKWFYIDIGAHHPKIISNTYKLYKKWWVWINIDPLPWTKKLFDRYRRRDTNLELWIWKKTSLLKYYMFEESTNNTFDEKCALQQIEEWLHLINKKVINVYSLSHICQQYHIKKIDFLTIDVEWFDLDILESIDWNETKPAVIAIEIFNLDFDKIHDNLIYNFLNKKWYKLHSYLIMTAIFTLKNK